MNEVWWRHWRHQEDETRLRPSQTPGPSPSGPDLLDGPGPHTHLLVDTGSGDTVLSPQVGGRRRPAARFCMMIKSTQRGCRMIITQQAEQQQHAEASSTRTRIFLKQKVSQSRQHVWKHRSHDHSRALSMCVCKQEVDWWLKLVA